MCAYFPVTCVSIIGCVRICLYLHISFSNHILSTIKLRRNLNATYPKLNNLPLFNVYKIWRVWSSSYPKTINFEIWSKLEDLSSKLVRSYLNETMIPTEKYGRQMMNILKLILSLFVNVKKLLDAYELYQYKVNE